MTSATSGSEFEGSGKPAAATTTPAAAAGGAPPQTPVLTIGCRMLRSPSHESVTTDLSLFSVSSIASEAGGTGGRMRLVTFKSYSEAQLTARGPSPNPPNKARPPDIPEIIWFEEENDLIKSCGALSSALGFQKSFSTSDISNLTSPDEASLQTARCAASDLALSALQRFGYFLDHSRLDHASRSCSTWVAVGDVASTSQLPSPHGGHSIPPAPTAIPPPPVFTAADLIRSVNKKVRQNYIKRRLLTTYKALERLSKSEFNLDRLELQAVSEAEKQAAVAAATTATATTTTTTTHLTVPGTRPPCKPILSPGSVIRAVKPENLPGKTFPLTLRDVERDRGKPLSKYERNMMIFNWLHTLDDAAFEGIQ